MTSHSTEHQSVEESPEKRVQLPRPDANNITVLTRELPNEPILPWHRFDSPWLHSDTETSAETLEEFVGGDDVEIHALDEQTLESRIENWAHANEEISDESDDELESSDLDDEPDADESDETEADAEADELADAEALEEIEVEQASDEISDLETLEADESDTDEATLGEQVIEHPETHKERHSVYLPEPDHSLIDPNVPLGTLTELPPLSENFPPSHHEDEETDEDGQGSSVSLPSVRMDETIGLAGDRHEPDIVPDYEP